MSEKLSFYTVFGGASLQWIGRCKQYPDLKYVACTRTAAMSGIRRMAKKLQTTVKKPKKVNEVVFILDRSSSMTRLAKAALDALRQNIKTLKKVSKETEQETYVTIVLFNQSSNIAKLRVPIDVISVDDLSTFCAGTTALFDTVGMTICKLQGEYDKKRPCEHDDVSYLIITITDGEENSSQQWHAGSLKDLMDSVIATDRWTLTFLLPPGSKRMFCNTFKFNEGNVKEWSQTEEGIKEYADDNSIGITNYYNARSAGQTSVMDFYTDMSKVNINDVKSKLINIRNEVSVFDVKKECNIREFCESNTLKPYVKGAAFYQLTKEEKKVQPYKNFMIMKKFDGAIYAGSEARKILKLPENVTVRIIPGNHSDYDIFIQSTSVNRKLVRGTKLIYYPSFAHCNGIMSAK